MWWFIALLLPLKTYASVHLIHTNLHTGTDTNAQVQYFSLVSSTPTHGAISVEITHDSGTTTTVNIDPDTLPQYVLQAISSDPAAYDNIWLPWHEYPSLPSPTFTAVNAATFISVSVDGSPAQTLDLSSLGVLPTQDDYFEYDMTSWSMESKPQSDTGTVVIVSTNLHANSSSSDGPQFIRILNDAGIELNSSQTQQFVIDVLDSANIILSTITFPATTWTVDDYLILSSDASAFDSDFFAHFSQSAETGTSWSAVDQPSTLLLWYGSEFLQAVDLIDTNAFTRTLDSSNYEYYDYSAGVWSIVSAGGGGTSSSASASASPAPASASPSPAGCQPGVWNQGTDYAAQSGVVPFGPQLIAQGLDRTRLVWDGQLQASAIQFRVRFASWHDTYSLTTGVCTGTDTAETANPTEPQGCGYTIYEASFPLDTCTFQVTDQDEFRTVSGFVVATANMTTTFLGTEFPRTFRLPLGFFFTLSTTFTTTNSITIKESNNCYDENDCNQFDCTTDPDTANVCDCSTVYGSNNHGSSENTDIGNYCDLAQEHSGDKCQTDGVSPYCSVPADITVTYTAQTIPTNISEETNSDAAWFNPFWDDCDAPFNTVLHDIASVEYTITGGTPLDTSGSLGQVYTDSSAIPNTVFETDQDQSGGSVTYNIGRLFASQLLRPRGARAW